MHLLIAAIALTLALVSGLGFACALLPRGRRDLLTLVIVTVGLSLGLLTLSMFWVAVLLPGRLSLATALLPVVLLALAGVALARGDLRPDPFSPSGFARPTPIQLALVLVLIVIAAGIVFNAAYWPFSDEDALVIYAPLARRIFETGSLPSGSLYEGYPMLVPLAYAYSHWVVGGLNESVARLVPAVMALGAIGAAGVLGRDMRSPRIGLASAGLVALTPLFGRWASTGYVDVPASFYFVLTAVAAWRWLRTSMWQDAVLTGLFCGLALFTKSDALTLLVSLAALIVLRWRQERAGASLRWSQVGWMGVALLGVAAPWYLRNLAVNGFLLPPTIWIASARHDGTTALILLRDFQHFSLPGWLFTASLVYGGVQAVRSGWRRRLVWATLLAFAVPFLAAWWWLASYDERFLVSIVPILSVMAGLFIDDSLAWLNPHLGRTAVRWAAWACVALILVLAVPAFQKTVEGKRAILRNPWMSDAEKHRELLGGQYDLALEVDRLPPGSRVLGLPSRLMYYVDGLHLGGIGTGIAESPPWDRAGDYDYVVYRFSLDDKPEWACHVEPIFQSDDGYHLYTTDPAGVLPTSACDPG